MPQRIQCALIKVAGLSCFCGAVCTEQMAFLHIQIERSTIIGAAIAAAHDLRHKAALAHGAQFKHGLDHPQVRFALADHIETVEQQPKLPLCLLPGGRKGHCHFSHIHGKAHALNAGRDAVKDIFHFCFPHSVHVAARHQCELGVAEQPARAEQLALQPQAALRCCRDHAQFRCQDRQNAVRFLIAGLLQHQTRGYKGFHFLGPLPGFFPAAVVYNRDNEECFPCRQTPASLLVHPFAAPLPCYG